MVIQESSMQDSEELQASSSISIRLARSIPMHLDQHQASGFSVEVIFSSNAPTRPSSMDCMWVFVTLVDEYGVVLENRQTLEGTRTDSPHSIRGREERFAHTDLATAAFFLSIKASGRYRLLFNAINMERSSGMQEPDLRDLERQRQRFTEGQDDFMGKVLLSLLSEPFHVSIPGEPS